MSSAGVFGVSSRNFRDLPPDGSGARFLHTMLRVSSLDATLAFFNVLGLVETRRSENPSAKFTLVFLATAPGEPELELTWNWGGEDASRMVPSRNFGHLAFAVDDIYATCRAFQAQGVAVLRPPRDGAPSLGFTLDLSCPFGHCAASVHPRPFPRAGKMAFVQTPDGISVELLQKADALPPQEPWASMANTSEW